MHWIATGLIATTLVTRAAMADTPPGAVDLSEAWVPATSQIRGDAPLYMTIANHGDTPDGLIRARCPTDLADFTEKHATDRGEGGTAMREVKSFLVPANGTVLLRPGGDHLMLLHIRVPLRAGQTFPCSLVFQKAGVVTVEVTVATGGAKEGP